MIGGYVRPSKKRIAEIRERIKARGGTHFEYDLLAEIDALQAIIDQQGIVTGEDARLIEREIREGTPNTPERIAAINRADKAFKRSGIIKDN
jgi:hypothetical protein